MKKVIRVVTSNYCIPAHLHNTLNRIPDGFQLYIVGENVSYYSGIYKDVIFIDIPIRRNFSFFPDIYSLMMLVIHFRKIKPDIVHSLMTKAGLFAALAGKLAGVEIRLHTFTGQVWAYKKGISRSVLKFVDKLICDLNTACLTDSPSQSDYLFINGIKKRSTPLPCLVRGSLSGVDLTRFDRKRLSTIHARLKSELEFNDSDFILGYIARKSLDKGCIDMLEIFSKIKKLYPFVKLLYIGPDESNGQVEAYLDENPTVRTSITNRGFVHNHEDYLGLCRLLCLPSYREGFGSIVIDAAALEIPAIGYEIPGLVDSIVNGSTGKLVECGDRDNFVEAVKYFIDNPDVLNEYSVNARAYAEKFFNADLLNDELYNVYRRLGV